MTPPGAPSVPSPIASDAMVSVQIRQALRDVPRDAFLGRSVRSPGQAVGRSIPSQVAAGELLASLRLQPEHRLLHIGTGSGYIAAVAAQVCAEVYTVERLTALTSIAENRFAAMGYDNIVVRQGDGFAGWDEHAPFDRILVSAQTDGVPPSLLMQLVEGGCLVMTVGEERARQQVVRITHKKKGQDEYEDVAVLDFATPDEHQTKHRSASHETLCLPAVSPDERERIRNLALERGVRRAEVDSLLTEVEPNLFEEVPRAFCDHNRMLPLRVEDGELMAAATDPEAPVDDLAKALGLERAELYLVTAAEFRRLWQTIEVVLAHPVVQQAASTHAKGDVIVGDSQGEVRAVRLFETLLLEAIGERASDIHLERYGERVRTRLRVDGELRDSSTLVMTPGDLVSLINVVKIRSNLDISEHRLPQGGRIHMRAGDQVFDLRIQTQPSLYGEHLVIRLLPEDSDVKAISDIGFSPALGHEYERLLDHPAGMILVVGPTGSGKSTTLYAGLRRLAADTSRKVITVEDPIEYALKGIQQCAVRPGIGFNFADAMRAFVREDPDVILVGEIRDGETALEAIRASQTGHLVLSTLHSNDAVDAVQRLFDLGMHANSIASELLAVFAQRLARRNCPHCVAEATPEAHIMAELFPDGAPSGFTCYKGEGCERCSQRGTHGRIAATEFLRLGATVRRAISRQLPVDDLRAVAVEGGLQTMRDSALRLVRDGVIPLSELPRILPAERMHPERR